jgi:hypothetical protein
MRTQKFSLVVLCFAFVCLLIGQGFICSYMFMAVCSVILPFYEVTFCGVLSDIFDKLRCATGEKRLQNTALLHLSESFINTFSTSSL